jgi:hypothetical protein
LSVADGPPLVEQHDQSVLTVEELIDEFMNAAWIAAKRFSKRHRSHLRSPSSHRGGDRSVTSSGLTTAIAVVSRLGACAYPPSGR